jgi:hypothetical protein
MSLDWPTCCFSIEVASLNADYKALGLGISIHLVLRIPFITPYCSEQKWPKKRKSENTAKKRKMTQLLVSNGSPFTYLVF